MTNPMDDVEVDDEIDGDEVDELDDEDVPDEGTDAVEYPNDEDVMGDIPEEEGESV